MFNVLRPLIPWLATTVFSIVLIITNQNPLGQQLRGYLIDVLINSAYPVTAVQRTLNVWSENTQLHKTLAEMSLDLSEYLDSYYENIQLRKMLAFDDRSQFDLIAAKIIGYAPDPGLTGLVINKGSADSISSNQAVICMEGLVGRICRTGFTSATVQLLTDPNLGIAARLLRKRDNGIVHTSQKGQLVLNGIPISSEVAVGDTIITSGLGGVFPRGIIIGTISELKTSENNWLWDITLDPTVHFSRLEEVFVIHGDHRAQ